MHILSSLLPVPLFGYEESILNRLLSVNEIPSVTGDMQKA